MLVLYKPRNINVVFFIIKTLVLHIAFNFILAHLQNNFSSLTKSHNRRLLARALLYRLCNIAKLINLSRCSQRA